MKNLSTLKVNDSWWSSMIAHDSWWLNERARFNYHRLSSTIIDYHAPFDQSFNKHHSPVITIDLPYKMASSISI